MSAVQKIEAAEAASHALRSPAAPGGALPRTAMPGHAVPNHDVSRYHRKLSRVLNRMGGTYLLSDILAAIAEGRMQSFSVNNSWAITQVQQFPRARQLQLVALVGDLADVDALHAKLLAYADENNCDLLSTYGRMGWLREGSWRRLGWRMKTRSQLYQKEL